MSEESEKLREEAPWGALCSRIGIWNFPQDDGMDDASSSRWTWVDDDISFYGSADR